MADADLRELERRARTTGDPVVALEHARALARTGEPAAALRALAPLAGLVPIRDDVLRIAGPEPWSEDVLRALDAATHGGVDPDAPWPCAGGDGWRTGRARVSGPGRGEVVSRRRLEGHAQVRVAGFVVDATGRALAVGGAPAPGPASLVWVASDGRVTPTGLIGSRPLLLAAGPAADAVRALRLDGPGGMRAHDVGPRRALAAGHLVFARGDAVIAASLATGVERWRRDPGGLRGEVERLTVLPGPTLVLELGGFALPPAGNHWQDGGLERLDLATGALVHARDDEASLDLAGPGGAVFGTEPGRGPIALGPDLRPLWRRDGPERPLVLAGEAGGEVLIADAGVAGGGRRQPRRSLIGLDAATGDELWRALDSRHDDLAVDRRGVLYLRRGEHLVAIAPRTGEVTLRVRVGARGRRWSFAFAPGGRAFALREVGDEVELVVLE